MRKIKILISSEDKTKTDLAVAKIRDALKNTSFKYEISIEAKDTKPDSPVYVDGFFAYCMSSFYYFEDSIPHTENPEKDELDFNELARFSKIINPLMYSVLQTTDGFQERFTGKNQQIYQLHKAVDESLNEKNAINFKKQRIAHAIFCNMERYLQTSSNVLVSQSLLDKMTRIEEKWNIVINKFKELLIKTPAMFFDLEKGDVLDKDNLGAPLQTLGCQLNQQNTQLLNLIKEMEALLEQSARLLRSQNTRVQHTYSHRHPGSIHVVTPYPNLRLSLWGPSREETLRKRENALSGAAIIIGLVSIPLFFIEPISASIVLSIAILCLLAAFGVSREARLERAFPTVTMSM